MARRLPSLNALRAFESAARHVSFTLAAGEMNVSHAAVSRHIRELEAWLGFKLFNRTGRGVELTEEGARFAPEVSAAFDALRGAVERYARGGHRDSLVISAEVSFAALWLVPRLGGFTALHPGIELAIDPTNRLVDFAKGEADLGIRYGGGNWDGVHAQKLADSAITPVCSPTFLRTAKVRQPLDLARVPLLREESKEHWHKWLEAVGVADKVQPGGPLLKGHLAIAAAEAGQGFAVADQIQCLDALRAGRLVCPFDIVIRQQAYWLVRGTGARPKTSATMFSDWLRTEVDQSFANFDPTRFSITAPQPGRSSRKS